MPRRVLIIDDSESVRHSLQAVLEDQGVFDEFLMASDGLAGFAILRDQPVDLVLCDLIMPGVDGFKFMSFKQADRRFDDIPVILLTAREDVRSKVRGLDAGASDYLTKPFEALELIARVNVHLKIKDLQDELREKNRELEVLAKMDPLTNVANRRHFLEILEREYLRSRRYDRPLSLVMIDLDRFKQINDERGHQAGDQALTAAAATLSRALREQDIIGRYGGEEFAMVLPETDRASALVVAERCRRALERSSVVVADGRFGLTASMGVAVTPDDRIDSMADLIRLADEAMYEAKRTGRNRIVPSDSFRYR